MAFTFRQGDRPLPGYTIQRGVGRGGFGEVYYATSDGGKEVALKYLRDNPQVELRGVQHCLNLKSPHLVAIHDIRQNVEGEFFVVMEFVSGASLRELMIAEPSGLGTQKAAYLLREIAKGLAYLHDRGIVHRDLKPGNIFYEDGYVKIGDYGLAKAIAPSQHSGQTMSVGTVHYMAPEIGSGNYDRTIDVYALGVILYEMALGRVPFSGSTMGEVLMKHLTAQPEVDALPAPFPDVIRKALAKDPKDRFQTVHEMVAALFATADLDQSVASFEPNSLSVAAERVMREVRLQAPVMAGGGGGISPFGTGSSNVGQQAVPPPVVVAPGSGGRLPATPAGIASDSDVPYGFRGVRWELKPHVASKLGSSIAIAVALSFGVSLVAGKPSFEGAAHAFLYIAAIVQAVLIGNWLNITQLRMRGEWGPRLIITGLAGLSFVGVAALGSEIGNRSAANWLTVLLVTMFLADWSLRFNEGRKQKIDIGSAFSVGLLAWIVGFFVARGDALVIAAVAASASLVVQAVAGMWPLTPVGSAPLPHAAPAAGTPVPARAVTPAARGFFNRAQQIEPAVAVDPRSATLVPPGIPVVNDYGSKSLQTSDERVFASATVRAAWLVAAGACLVAGVLSFASTGLMSLQGDDFTMAIVGGEILMGGFLYSVSRAIVRRRRGYLRSYVRPAIFAMALTAVPVTGTIWGQARTFSGEEQLAALAVILASLMAAGCVWLVPIPAPVAARAADANDSERLRRVAGQLKLASLILYGLALIMLVMIMCFVSEHEWDEAMPATVLPLGVAGTICMIVGVAKGRSAGRDARKQRAERLALPLRRVFEIGESSNLGRMIERHLALVGYTLANKSDLLWSFVRGSFPAQFWQSDIRQWKTRLNIAAYELNGGGYRITCFLDLDAGFNSPSQKMVAILEAELSELRELLGGRETSTAPMISSEV